MSEWLSRTELLIGEQAINKLKASRVAIFGVGGVGGYTLEALARSGVGTIDIIDNDVVSESNLNRQILATVDKIGKSKVEVAKDRVESINPNIKVNIHNTFFLPENSDIFDFSSYNYIVDAIDTVSGKIELVVQAEKHNVPIISSMGAGNKLDATGFEVTDIYKTSVCPLARVMRRELKKRGIENLKVVYSKSPSVVPENKGDNSILENKKTSPGSVAFVPSVAGLIMAGEVVLDLIGKNH